MKMNAALVFVFGVFVLQNTYAQCIRSAPMVAAAPIIQSNNVGATLADTLSLLTVSSLLAEKLPFDYPCGCTPYAPPCAPFIPPYAPYEFVAPCAPTVAPIAPILNNCGCGCGGYPYNAYVL
ncbi:uncharacterized protein LOC120625423 [Pararge aegeria]|uniref:Uncharacterized protein n=1 Tax=Pararge aegeria TaxID=116150 RepID=S4P6T8_9NEOP|nr:uncharacterized protein LOC120625423 [Pararge aegeria]